MSGDTEMMPLRPLACIGALAVCALFPAEAHSQTWARRYEPSTQTFLQETSPRAAGGSLAVGHLGATPSTRRAVMLVLDQTGTLERASVADAALSSSFRDVKERHDEAVVCGALDGRPWLGVFDPRTGQRRFQLVIGTEPGQFSSLAETSDGGFVAVGSIETPDERRDALILRLDRFLSIEWISRYGGTGDDAATSVVGTDDGACVVAGELRTTSPSAQRVWLMKLDRAGAVL